LEVDSSGAVMWNYVSPVNLTNINVQGTPRGDNAVFKVQRYAPYYPGFNGQALPPGAPIEINPLSYTCSTNTVGLQQVHENDISLRVSPNPATQKVLVAFTVQDKGTVQISITDVTGRAVLTLQTPARPGNNSLTFAVDGLPAGIYLLRMTCSGGSAQQKLMIR